MKTTLRSIGLTLAACLGLTLALPLVGPSAHTAVEAAPTYKQYTSWLLIGFCGGDCVGPRCCEIVEV